MKDVDEFAQKIRDARHPSDLWFQKNWKALGMSHEDDRFNVRFLNTYPDLVNHKFKYVVECDDPTHLKPERREHDKRKNSLWRSHGYTVFRIKAWNKGSLITVTNKIKRSRGISTKSDDEKKRAEENRKFFKKWNRLEMAFELEKEMNILVGVDAIVKEIMRRNEVTSSDIAQSLSVTEEKMDDWLENGEIPRAVLNDIVNYIMLPKTVKINHSYIQDYLKNGPTEEQAKILCLDWPLKKSWKKEILGLVMSREMSIALQDARNRLYGKVWS